MDKIKYDSPENCAPVEPRLCTAWEVEFATGEKRLSLWYKEAKIEDVIGLHQALFPDDRFKVSTIDVGSFLIDPSDTHLHSYSHDARRVDNEMNVSLKGWE